MNILVKLSGEILSGNTGLIHDINVIKDIANQIKELYENGHQVSIVVGGGNICRGATMSEAGVDRPIADHMGMLGTAINALMIQSVLESMDLKTRVLSAISINAVCEPFILRRARNHLSKGRIVIFASGTGTPFFSTDTAAVLRSIEMKCDLLIKATKVDGVYDKDPKKHQDAIKLTKVSYSEVIMKNLNVMDMAAIALAQENKLQIRICSILTSKLLDVVTGSAESTDIS